MPSKFPMPFFIILVILALALTTLLYAPYLSGLVFALVFAVIFRPLYAFCARWIGSWLAAFLSTVVALLVIVGPIAFFTTQLVGEARALIASAEAGQGMALADITTRIDAVLRVVAPGVSFDLVVYVKAGAEWFGNHAASIFSGTVQAAVNTIIGIIALFFLFKDGTRLRDRLIALSPLPDEYDRLIMERLRLTVRSVVMGSIMVAIIQGFLTGIGFWIFGVPSAALWGSVAAIGALIPGIGTSIIVIPAVLYLFFFGSLLQTVGLLLWGAAFVGLIDNMLGPKLMSRGASIHQFFIFLSVIGGLQLFGPLGFIIGPLIVSFLFTLFDMYGQYLNAGKKGLAM